MSYLPGFPETIAVRRDAFFSFLANAQYIDAEEAFRSLSFEVRSGNQLVEGTATLLDREGPEWSYQIWVGWQASSPRPVGETLEFYVEAPTNHATRGVLLVKEAEPELQEPSHALQRWSRTMFEDGETVLCQTSDGSPALFYETAVNALDARAELPSPDVAVAWKYEVEQIHGKGELAYQPTPSRVFGPGSQSISARFLDALDEYCVRVTARDLRTEESLSAEACGSPGADPPTDVNGDRIVRCTFESVPEQFRPRWCALRNQSPADIAACEHKTGPPGEGGAPNEPEPVTGGGTTAAGPDTAGGEPIDIPAGSDDDDATARATSKGCSCGVSQAAQRDSWLAFGTIALFALGLARRAIRD